MVQFIKWQDEYSVQMPAIDEQHKQILVLINDLYNKLQEEYTKKEVHDILLKLKIFSETHLKYEETLLSYADFPDLEAHRGLHQAFIDKVKSYNVDHFITGQEVFLFLKEWWIQHITTEDRKYMPYLAQLGL